MSGANIYIYWIAAKHAGTKIRTTLPLNNI